MPYIEYNKAPLQIKPIQHLSLSLGPARSIASIPKPQPFHPPSIHNYSLQNPYLYNIAMKKMKKSVSWNENNTFYETFSKYDYDRKIDNEQIRNNMQAKSHYQRLKMDPLTRSSSVFQMLDTMNFEK